MNNTHTDLMLTQTQADAVLSAWLKAEVNCQHIERLEGGMINSVLKLEFDRAPFTAVIKFSLPGNSFQSEADALRYLSQHTRFPSPHVYQVDDSAQLIPFAYLLIETIPGECLAGVKLPDTELDHLDRQLAQILAELHSHTRSHFGGINEQPGKTIWSDVFIPRLLEVRGEPEITQRLSHSVLADIDQAIDLAGEALKDQGRPALIHGDIWSGNLLVSQSEQGWQINGIIDPGLYFADAEEEIAYLEVFNGRREAFFEEYTKYHALRPGYAYRRLFYWLNTALIHVWIFGDAFYCEFAAETARSILNNR